MLKFILATLIIFVVVKLFLMEYVIGSVICDKILHIYDTDEFNELSMAYLAGKINTFAWASKVGDYIAKKLFGKFHRVYWVMCTLATIITIPWGILFNGLIILFVWLYRKNMMN